MWGGVWRGMRIVCFCSALDEPYVIRSDWMIFFFVGGGERRRACRFARTSVSKCRAKGDRKY